MNARELLPCPWCGCFPTVEPWHGGVKTKHAVHCENDNCPTGPMTTGETKDKAIARWNIRAAQQPSHTDHPARHWDRTCPACIAESEQRPDDPFASGEDIPITRGVESAPVAYGPARQDYPGGPIYRVGTSTGTQQNAAPGQIDSPVAATEAQPRQEIERGKGMPAESPFAASDSFSSKRARQAIELFLEYRDKHGASEADAIVHVSREFDEAQDCVMPAPDAAPGMPDHAFTSRELEETPSAVLRHIDELRTYALAAHERADYQTEANALRAENESLRAECGFRQIQGYNEGKAAMSAKLRKDAERYRWIRNENSGRNTSSDSPSAVELLENDNLTSDQLDAAIDAATGSGK